MSEGMPDDLKKAYELFTLLCLQRGFVYAAVMISKDPLGIYVIGNVTETGHDLAELLRMHADLIDDKHVKGQVAPIQPIDQANTN